MDKEILLVHSNILKRYNYDIKSLPEFINTKDINNVACRELALLAFERVSSLISVNILTNRVVKRLFSYTLDCVGEMVDLDPPTAILYYGYIFQLVESYREICIENELYEGATNINNYMKEYEKNEI